MPSIRPIAICPFLHAGKILVFEARDEVKGETFYRPLGGGIEFGESAAKAIRREIFEEIGAQISEVRYLYTLENIFTCNGQPGHEIVLVFDARLVDASLYERPQFDGREDNQATFNATWKPLSDFGEGGDRLYPEGLLERLREEDIV